jgi:hypothetical protein
MLLIFSKILDAVHTLSSEYGGDRESGHMVYPVKNKNDGYESKGIRTQTNAKSKDEYMIYIYIHKCKTKLCTTQSLKRLFIL